MNQASHSIGEIANFIGRRVAIWACVSMCFMIMLLAVIIMLYPIKIQPRNTYNFIDFNDGQVFINPKNITHMYNGILGTCQIRMINETKYETLEVGGSCEDIINAIYELE